MREAASKQTQVSPGIDMFHLRSGRPVRKRSGYIELEPDSVTNAMPLPAHAVLAEGLVWLPVEWGDDGSNGGIVGMDPRNGEVRARHLIEDRHVVGTVAVCDSVLYFADTPSGGGSPPLARTSTALNAVQVADGPPYVRTGTGVTALRRDDG